MYHEFTAAKKNGMLSVFFAMQAAREAARRMQCGNNMKQIALALHNYEAIYRSFPPAYTVDESGQPLHSWRTLILPFMEYDWLYQQIDLSKPWDDPVNRELCNTEIPAFSCPSTGLGGSNLTNYQLVVDDRALIYGSEYRRFSEVTDGLSNTLMFVETLESDAVPWMKPQDIPMDRFLNAGRRSNHTGGFNAAFGDGSVQFLSEQLTQEILEGLVTRNGGESV